MTYALLVLQWGRAMVSAETSRAMDSLCHSRSLQWGRALVSAETGALRMPRAPLGSLQWGRALVSAETSRRGNGHHQEVRASMGPRSGERGNTVVSGGPGKNLQLQWGRALV